MLCWLTPENFFEFSFSSSSLPQFFLPRRDSSYTSEWTWCRTRVYQVTGDSSNSETSMLEISLTAFILSVKIFNFPEFQLWLCWLRFGNLMSFNFNSNCSPPKIPPQKIPLCVCMDWESDLGLSRDRRHFHR